MCGRYFFQLEEHPAFMKLQKKIDQMNLFTFASGVVYPSNKALVLVNDKHHDYSLDVMKWGIDGLKGSRLINARSEGIARKQTFQTMLKQRCLIPCNGFFEWSKQGTSKHKIYVQIQDEPLFYLAAIYNKHKEFVIISGESQNMMQTIHARTPILVHEENVIPYLLGITPFTVDNHHLVLSKVDANQKKKAEQLTLFNFDEA